MVSLLPSQPLCQQGRNQRMFSGRVDHALHGVVAKSQIDCIELINEMEEAIEAMPFASDPMNMAWVSMTRIRQVQSSWQARQHTFHQC